MSDSVHIRPATHADVDAILELDRATAHAPHWPRATYVAMVESAASSHSGLHPGEVGSASIHGPSGHGAEQHHTGPVRVLLVADAAESGAGLLGYAAAAHLPSMRGSGTMPAELESIGVATTARRCGVGRALSCALIEWARQRGAPAIELEVRESNSAAVGLYCSLGFSQFGRRPNYYSNPEEDALLLRFSL